MLGQTHQQLGRRLLQQAGGELMQQAPNLFGRIDEQARFFGRSVADRERAGLCVFKQARQVREVGEADRRRAAGQRVCERDRGFADRAVELHRPLGDLGAEPARELVGLVQVNVEQRDADAQGADDLDVFVVAGAGFGHGFDRRLDERRDVERQVEVSGRGRQRLDQRRHARPIQEIEVEVEVDFVGCAAFGRFGQRQQIGRLRIERVVQCGGAQVERRVLADDSDIVLFHVRCPAVEVGEVQLECRQRPIVIGRRWRVAELRRAGFEAGCARRIERSAERAVRRFGLEHRRRRRAAAGEVSGFDHRRRVVHAAALLGNVVDPAGEIGQAPVSEVEQRRRGGSLVGEVGVVELLAGPRTFAKLLQPDHARAALERVEGAAQRSQQVQVVRCKAKCGARVTGVAEHLARFFEKNLAHLVVLRKLGAGGRRCEVEPHRRADASAQVRRVEVDADRVGRGRNEVDQRFRELAARGDGVGVRVAGLFESFLRAQHGRGERRLVGSLRFVREALKVACDLGDRHVFAHRREREQLRLFDQARLDRRTRRGDTCRCRHIHFSAPHHRAQLARFGVVGEQRLRHLRLHAEHVNQETERAEVAGEAIEHAGLRDTLGVELDRNQPVDLVAHAQQRSRGVVHAQHRKHAAHRREVARHRDQQLAFFGSAEVLVDQLLGFGEARSQLLHDAAHGLAVGDAAVEVFHPAFERVGRAAPAHGGKPVGEALHACGLLGVVEVDVIERGFDVEQAGRDLHCQRCGRGGA